MIQKILNFSKWCIGVFLCVLFVVFTVNNREHMTLDLYPFPLIMELPKFLYALAFFAGGLALAALIRAGQASKLKRRIRDINIRNTALENELAGLRSDLQNQPGASLLSSMKDAA